MLFIGRSCNVCVHRVLSFFSSRRNWDSPTPSPLQAAVTPPPPPVPGGGSLASGRGGRGVPIPTRGHTLWYSVYTVQYMYFVPASHHAVKHSQTVHTAEKLFCVFMGL